MSKETAGKIRMIVQWVLVALCVFCALGWVPSLSSVLFLLAALILLPVKKIGEVFEKIKIKFVVRIVAAFIIFVVACCITPEEAPSTAAKKEAQKSSSSEDKDKKDDKKDSSKNDKANDADVKAQLLDTWHYEADRAIDFYYTFNEDGTFEMSSDGGATDEGTYEIVDGKTIKLSGQYYSPTFTIKSADKLVDKDDLVLIRYVRDTTYDDDDD